MIRFETGDSLGGLCLVGFKDRRDTSILDLCTDRQKEDSEWFRELAVSEYLAIIGRGSTKELHVEIAENEIGMSKTTMVWLVFDAHRTRTASSHFGFAGMHANALAGRVGYGGLAWKKEDVRLRIADEVHYSGFPKSSQGLDTDLTGHLKPRHERQEWRGFGECSYFFGLEMTLSHSNMALGARANLDPVPRWATRRGNLYHAICDAKELGDRQAAARELVQLMEAGSPASVSVSQIPVAEEPGSSAAHERSLRDHDNRAIERIRKMSAEERKDVVLRAKILSEDGRSLRYSDVGLGRVHYKEQVYDVDYFGDSGGGVGVYGPLPSVVQVVYIAAATPASGVTAVGDWLAQNWPAATVVWREPFDPSDE